LDVLIKERPRITTALEELGRFSETVSGLVNDTQADLMKNLQNLEPTLKALADVGPELDTAIAYIPTFPLTQNLIDRGVRGDYVNLFVTIDLTNARIKRGLLLGTRLGQDRASLIPAPGDPGYDAYYTKFPLGVGTSPPFGPIPNTAPAPWEPGGGG
jgi:ABC-type transporter Mla subunit MlaD